MQAFRAHASWIPMQSFEPPQFGVKFADAGTTDAPRFDCDPHVLVSAPDDDARAPSAAMLDPDPCTFRRVPPGEAERIASVRPEAVELKLQGHRAVSSRHSARGRAPAG